MYFLSLQAFVLLVVFVAVGIYVWTTRIQMKDVALFMPDKHPTTMLGNNNAVLVLTN